MIRSGRIGRSVDGLWASDGGIGADKTGGGTDEGGMWGGLVIRSRRVGRLVDGLWANDGGVGVDEAGGGTDEGGMWGGQRVAGADGGRPKRTGGPDGRAGADERRLRQMDEGHGGADEKERRAVGES